MGKEGYFPGELAEQVGPLVVGKADGQGAHQTAVSGHLSPMPLPRDGPGLLPIACFGISTEGPFLWWTPHLSDRFDTRL